MAVSKPKSYGSQMEPCYVFRNVFQEKEEKRGTKLKDIIKASFNKHGKGLPTPKGKSRWASWKHKSPANGKGLVPITKKLLAYLMKHHKGDRHVHSQPNRGFHCGHINVTSAGGGQGWHQDGQDYGRLVFIFAAGNTCESKIRLGGKKGKHVKKIVFRSGDCMVFEGQTWHTVKKCIPKTSPLKDKKSWLRNRRVSALVRQHSAKKKAPKRPHFLKKK